MIDHSLCSVALTTWDHEAGHEPEGVFVTAIDWFTDAYESFIDADTSENTVHVTDMSDGVSKTAAVVAIKRISDMSSSELLGQLRSGSFAVTNVVRSEAFALVCRLHDLESRVMWNAIRDTESAT